MGVPSQNDHPTVSSAPAPGTNPSGPAGDHPLIDHSLLSGTRSNWWLLVTWAVVFVLIVGSAYYRSTRRDFVRAVGTDELITLQNYTWAGVEADGTRRELKRLGDIEHLRIPSLREMLIGVYCSLGRWPEPNNHVVHSFLLNASLPLFDTKEVALRLPALLAAVAFSLAVVFACWKCKWYTTAIPAGVLAFWLPYVVAYSQEARGYTLMLFLLVIFSSGCQEWSRKPTSVSVSSFLVAVSILVFANTVNMAIDWVIPCYVLLMVFPGIFLPIQDAGQAPIRRKSLVVQSLCIGSVGFVFLVDRLPYVYSSSQQYGVPFSSSSEFAELLLSNLRYLFPSHSLIVFAVLGGIGMCLAWGERPGRGYVAMSGFAVLATLLHFGVGKRFAYERNLGYWLVPVIFGYACLGQRLIDMPRRAYQRIAAGVAVYATTLVFLVPGFLTTTTDVAYESFRVAIRELPPQGETPGIALLGKGVPGPIELDLPVNWSLTKVPTNSDHDIDLLLIEKIHSIPLWGVSPTPVGKDEPVDWPRATTLVHDGVYTIACLPCRVSPPGPSVSSPKVILIWYPSFDAVATSPQQVLDFLERSGMNHHTVYSRYQAKMEVFSRLTCVIGAGLSSEKVRMRFETFEEARKRFGGEIVALTPRE